MNWEFKDRIVTKIGTVYSHYIGSTGDTRDEEVESIKPEAAALKGTIITINGVASKVLDVQVSMRCNLTDYNYYVNILTDEEFKQEEADFNI